LRDKEKNSEQKKKIPFSDLSFFTYRGGKRRGREKNQDSKKKERAIHPPGK